MIPYDQQMFGCGVPGDCLVTCIESILELPQGTLPRPHPVHFRSREHFDDHCDEVRAALKRLNLDYLTVDAETDEPYAPAGYAVRTHFLDPDSGSPHGHATVARGGEVVHDPSPELRGQTMGAACEWLILVPLDPAQPSGRFALEAQTALDGLARHALAEDEAGRTRDLRDYAAEHGITLETE